MNETEHTAQTVIEPPVVLLETAADCGVVRAPLSLEGAHTHTEPSIQREQEPEDDGDLPTHSLLGLADLDIDLNQFDSWVRLERTKRAVRRAVDAEERQLMPIPRPSVTHREVRDGAAGGRIPNPELVR